MPGGRLRTKASKGKQRARSSRTNAVLCHHYIDLTNLLTSSSNKRRSLRSPSFSQSPLPTTTTTSTLLPPLSPLIIQDPQRATTLAQQQSTLLIGQDTPTEPSRPCCWRRGRLEELLKVRGVERDHDERQRLGSGDAARGAAPTADEDVGLAAALERGFFFFAAAAAVAATLLTAFARRPPCSSECPYAPNEAGNTFPQAVVGQRGKE